MGFLIIYILFAIFVYLFGVFPISTTVLNKVVIVILLFSPPVVTFLVVLAGCSMLLSFRSDRFISALFLTLTAPFIVVFYRTMQYLTSPRLLSTIKNDHIYFRSQVFGMKVEDPIAMVSNDFFFQFSTF